jgi:chromosome segregation ATPase
MKKGVKGSDQLSALGIPIRYYQEEGVMTDNWIIETLRGELKHANKQVGKLKQEIADLKADYEFECAKQAQYRTERNQARSEIGKIVRKHESLKQLLMELEYELKRQPHMSGYYVINKLKQMVEEE